MANVDQSGSEWQEERRKRITASNAYNLFTYAMNKNPDWQKKIGKLIIPNKYTIENLEYGKRTEAEARKWYESVILQKVTILGLIVHPNASFLGCSPDGCIFREEKLIEIKYYGQVQLNLFLLNLQKCDFVIYSKFSKSRYIYHPNNVR